MNLLTWLSRRRYPYEPLIRVEISESRLLHNLHEFEKLAPKDRHGKPQIAPVLKSNAYGHGLIEVAHILRNQQNIPFCVVDSYFEAIALRSKGFKTPLLIIGYTRPEIILCSNLKDIAFAVTSLETLQAIAEQKKDRWMSTEGKLCFRSPSLRLRPKMLHIHLKIDTGMRRQGILSEEIDEAIRLIENDSVGKRPIILEGIVSHLCDADNLDEAFTEKQICIWNKAVERFRATFKTLKYIHLSATDGQSFAHDIAANVARLGIGLYGLSENPLLNKRLDLHPVMQMKTIITGIKKLKEGETVGYSKTYTAADDMTIATVPVGYFEGINRKLSNNGVMLIGPTRVPCPIIGRVSMNITSLDVSHVPGIRIGDEVIAMSDDAKDENSIVNIAKRSDTIAYEIAVHIPAHLKRVVV